MAEVKHNLQHKTVLDDMLLNDPRITAGKVFGLECYKIEGKVFATLYGDGVGIKLPAERVEALKDRAGTEEFRPFNKNRGKNYIQITHADSQALRSEQGLLMESANFVLKEASAKK